MITPGPLRASARAVAVVAASVLLVSCAPPPPATTGSGLEVASAGAEQRCEGSLARLDALLAACAADDTYPPERIIEARALRSVAIDLTTTGDFDLALDLLDRAMGVLSRP